MGKIIVAILILLSAIYAAFYFHLKTWHYDRLRLEEIIPPEIHKKDTLCASPILGELQVYIDCRKRERAA